LLSAVIIQITPNPEDNALTLSIGYEIAVAENYAYVSNNYGVVVIDVSQHSDPIRVANISMNDDGAFGLHIVNELLYIAAPSDGLVIVDISIPTNPERLASHTCSFATNLFVAGEYVYVANGGSLSIFDISNSSAPEEIADLYVGTRGEDVTVVGDIAYYANPMAGLVVVNVSIPSSPDIIRTLPNSGGAWTISVHENVLYLGRHGSGLSIYDITSNESPILLGSFNNGGEVYGVSGDGELLAIADLQEGAELLNVTDPVNPVLIAEYPNAAPHSVFYDGVYTYLADQDQEFILIDFNSEGTPGYAVRTPGIETSWVIPISLISFGIAILIISIVLARTKMEEV